MAKAGKKKSPEEASNLFHNIMRASMKGNERKLYRVTFDNSNNPMLAQLMPPMSGKGHGLSKWDKETLFSKEIYVEAINKDQALIIAKEIAEKRIEIHKK